MKKILLIVVTLALVYGSSYLYFKGFLVGFKNGYPIVYTFTCADICPDYGSWYKKYYGEISQEMCLAMGGTPKLVGWGGYDGCEAK